MEVTPILFNLLKASYESVASLFAPGFRRPPRWNRWRWHRPLYAAAPDRVRCPFCPFPTSPGVFHPDLLAGPPAATLRHAGVLSLAPRHLDKSSLQHRETPPCRYLCPPPPHFLYARSPAVKPTSNDGPSPALKLSTPFGCIWVSSYWCKC